MKQKLTLLLVNLILHLRLQLVLQLQQLYLTHKVLQQPQSPLPDGGCLQQLLLVSDIDLGIGAYIIDQIGAVLYVAHSEGGFGTDIGVELDDLYGEVLKGADDYLEVLLILHPPGLRHRYDAGRHVRFRLQNVVNRHPSPSLYYGGCGAVRHLQELNHLAESANTVQVTHPGVINLGIKLGHGGHELVATVSVSDELDRLGAAHCYGYNHTRKENSVAQWQQRHTGGYVHILQLLVITVRKNGNDLPSLVYQVM